MQRYNLYMMTLMLYDIRIATPYEIDDAKQIARDILNQYNQVHRLTGREPYSQASICAIITATLLHAAYVHWNKTSYSFNKWFASGPNAADQLLTEMLTAHHDPTSIYAWVDHLNRPTQTHPYVSKIAQHNLRHKPYGGDSLVNYAKRYIEFEIQQHALQAV